MPEGTDVIHGRDTATGANPCDRRAAAITGFAAALRALREASGNPSFREMSGRSRAISHTTLHEAARGHRLPSWPTVVEFVKACGADPAALRHHWEDADRAVRAATPEALGTTSDTDTPDTTSDTISDASDASDAGHDIADLDDAPVTPRRRRGLVLGGIAAAAVIAIAVVVAVVATGTTTSDGRGTTAAKRPAESVLTGSGCPYRQQNPPPAPPRHPGDHGTFVTDVTVPDCSHVTHGVTFMKVWRFKNIGTVLWRGYSMHRLDTPAGRNNCQTITDVPIPTTAPGRLVDVRTEVTAPEHKGFCYVRFRIVDATGHDAFPAGRAISFQVYVD